MDSVSLSDIDSWLESHPRVFFVVLVVGPAIALFIFRIFTNEPALGALLPGLVIGLTFAIYHFVSK